MLVAALMCGRKFSADSRGYGQNHKQFILLSPMTPRFLSIEHGREFHGRFFLLRGASIVGHVFHDPAPPPPPSYNEQPSLTRSSLAQLSLFTQPKSLTQPPPAFLAPRKARVSKRSFSSHLTPRDITGPLFHQKDKRQNLVMQTNQPTFQCSGTPVLRLLYGLVVP